MAARNAEPQIVHRSWRIRPRFCRLSLGVSLNLDRLFLETLDDLASRSTPNASEYDLLRAAALLRELFLDESRLVDQVNRTLRTPTRFGVRVRARDPTDEFEMWLGIDPNDVVEDPIEQLDLTESLKVHLVSVPGSILTVRDIIRLAANVRGGVHAGKPRDPAHKAFERYRLKVSHGDMPLELVMVHRIAIIALEGLSGLRAVVSGRAPEATPRIPAAARVSVSDAGPSR